MCFLFLYCWGVLSVACSIHKLYAYICYIRQTSVIDHTSMTDVRYMYSAQSFYLMPLWLRAAEYLAAFCMCSS